MGTVIITGANGSLAIPAVSYLLSEYAPRTVILTVRNDTEEDKNTARLRIAIAEASKAVNVMIRKLDLASLGEVHRFAREMRAQVDAGAIPPLIATVWNAMTWTLQGGLQFSKDGYERSMAVNHLAHFALTLELLGSFDAERGRIIFLGSDSHEKSALQEYRTQLPVDDLDTLVHPCPDEEDKIIGRGFQRYGLSKLVTIMTMYELNRRLRNGLDGIGRGSWYGSLVDSRALGGPDVPPQWTRKVNIANLLQPVLKFINPALRPSATAAKDIIDFAVGPHGEGKTGYFIMKNKAESSRQSQDEDMQARLWNQSIEWAGIKLEDTVLTL